MSASLNNLNCEGSKVLEDWQKAWLEDVIGESGACNDKECSCHTNTNLAQRILDGEENWGAWEDR